MFQIFLRFYQFYWWNFKIIVKRYWIALEIALYKFIIIIIIIIIIVIIKSFTTVNQHSEGIKQDCVKININPLITHLSYKRFTTPAGSTSPTLVEEQCSLNDSQSRAVVVPFFHKLSINSQREPSRKH